VPLPHLEARHCQLQPAQAVQLPAVLPLCDDLNILLLLQW
jgi:hypothetical protein